VPTGELSSASKMVMSQTSITSTIIDGAWIMIIKNPPHPGLTVRHECLEPLGLSVTEAAKILGVTRQALNNLVNCKAGISPEMAIRLAKAFGSSPQTWLGMQADYDLAKALKHEKEIRVRRVSRVGRRKGAA
jgi:addiction module HigA family antidote